MFQQFKIDLQLQKSSFLVNLLAELSGFLVGFLLLNIVLRVDGDTDAWFCMGTLLALVIGVMLLLLAGGLSYSGEFQLAVAMGRTRGAFLGSYALRLLLHILLCYVVVLGLYHLELVINPLLFPGYDNEVAFSFLTDWKIIVPCALGILITAMFIGAVHARFGRKGLWVFYFIWLFCCIVLPRLLDDELGDSVLDRAALGVRAMFTALPPAVWLVLGGILAACMVTVTVILGKKQMVRL